MSENSSAAERHDVLIRSRKHIEITGVRDVISFDERSVIMVTDGGDMAVEGDGLKMGVLDTDKKVVAVDGRVSAVIYYDSEPTNKRKLFGKSKK